MPRRTTVLFAALAAGAAAVTSLLPATPAGAEPAPATAEPFTATRAVSVASGASLTVSGHGWGHGRGMGQYGSLGYATGHAGAPWDYRQILDHFYGGTTAGSLEDNPWMSVLLKGRTGPTMAVYRSTGLRVTGADGASVPGAPTYVSATLRSDGQYDVQVGLTCTSLGEAPPPPITMAGPVRVEPAPATSDHALRLCNADGSAVAYRGALVAMAQDFTGQKAGPFVVNLVHMDELMRGVVPHESPASWGELAGGAGINALKAQAVAARSYAAAGDTRWGDLHSGLGARATTCDDTFCQVYGGLAEISPDGAVTYHPSELRFREIVDRVITETSNEIRRTSSGAVARTEFSSSTGGYTAGGTFPAVADEGDSVPSNPNHQWSTTVPASTVAAKWSLGALTSVEITERNGLGAQGGRVTEVKLTGTAKSVEVTGNELRQAMGVKSDWYDITAPAAPVAPPVEPRSIDTVCPPAAASSFTDVAATNVHLQAINCLAIGGITKGNGDGTYGPARSVTRAQMASFLARLVENAGRSLPASPADAFTDDDASVHQANINRLAAAGIAAGTSATQFSPERAVTRAQMATFIARTFGYITGGALPTGTDAFGDDDGNTHEAAIDSLAAEGIAAGDGAGSFDPDGAVRRDQMASFLARTLALLDEGPST